jgi:hypothetical protein
MSGARILYWGDIDTHGFAILDRLRTGMPHMRSLMMDQATLQAHRSLWEARMRTAAITVNSAI